LPRCQSDGDVVTEHTPLRGSPPGRLPYAARAASSEEGQRCLTAAPLLVSSTLAVAPGADTRDTAVRRCLTPLPMAGLDGSGGRQQRSDCRAEALARVCEEYGPEGHSSGRQASARTKRSVQR